MSLTKNSAMSAEEIIQLKARVKAELLRRNGYNNISSYGGSDYDYQVQPGAGNPLRYEHISKIIEPLNAVNSDTVAQIYGDIEQGQRPKALDGTTGDTINSFLTALEGDRKTYYGTNHCKGQCSGLCVSRCTGGCTGCSGCGDTCSYNCSNECTGTLTGKCSGCTGTCTGSCGGCSGSCTGSCKGGCKDACTGGCKNTSNLCANCTNTCRTSAINQPV